MLVLLKRRRKTKKHYSVYPRIKDILIHMHGYRFYYPVSMKIIVIDDNQSSPISVEAACSKFYTGFYNYQFV